MLSGRLRRLRRMTMKISNFIVMILASSLLLASCALPPVQAPTVATTVATEQTVQTVVTDPTVITEPPTEPPTEPEKVQVIPPAIAMKEPADTDMVRVKDYIPDIAVELKYATTDNFTSQVIYTFTEAYLRYGTVKKLAAVQEALKSYGFGLKIWDAYRPEYGQEALWNACPNPNYVSRPGTGVRAHCRGHAVDITMVDAQGNEVEMPSGFDDFTALGDKDYSDCSEKAAYHAGLLDSAMRANGFYGYKKEWWHYVDYDNYSLEDLFDPVVVSDWYANCENTIPLRSAAATEIGPFLLIGRGETVTVLGYLEEFAYVDYAGYRGFVEKKDILPVE